MVEHELQEPVLQRLLNRLDRIEYRLVADSRDDISQLKDAVSNFHKARLQEQHDTMIADMWAAAPRAATQASPAPQVASHRGPGALYAKLPRPLPAGHAAEASPDPSTSTEKGTPSQRSAFSNALVKARQDSMKAGAQAASAKGDSALQSPLPTRQTSTPASADVIAHGHEAAEPAAVPPNPTGQWAKDYATAVQSPTPCPTHHQLSPGGQPWGENASSRT